MYCRRSLEPLQCPVCLDALRGLPEWKDVVTTPCGHLFCNTCLATALRYKLASSKVPDSHNMALRNVAIDKLLNLWLHAI